MGLQRLPNDILEKPDFESYFVGAESKIDQVLSSTWLKAHTKHWTWKNYIMANTPRCGPGRWTNHSPRHSTVRLLS